MQVQINHRGLEAIAAVLGYIKSGHPRISGSAGNAACGTATSGGAGVRVIDEVMIVIVLDNDAITSFICQIQPRIWVQIQP